MTLRKKTLLIISITVCLLMAVLYGLSRAIILKSFIALERDDARKHVERVVAALSNHLAALHSTAGDWSAWDDTCAFVEGTDPNYIADNLMDVTFENLHLNLMIFLDPDGAMVFGKAFDLSTQHATPLPDGLLAHLAPEKHLVRHRTTTSNVQGLLVLSGNPLLLVSRPIVNSENQGPIRGTLILGRYLDDVEVHRMAEIVNLSLRLYHLSADPVPGDVANARTQLSQRQPTLIDPLSPSLLAVYRLIDDIYGQPAAIAQITLPRSIYHQGEQSIRSFLSLLFAACAVIGLIMLLLLEHLVVSRLVQLHQSVSRIRTGKNLAMRVALTGHDEFRHLADAMNEMLTSLEHSQILLRKLEKAVETTEVGITITDNDGRIVYTNPADAHMHGYRVEDLLGEPANIFAPSELIETADEQGRDLDFQNWKRERLNCRKDGSNFPVMLISNPITDPQGQPLGKVVVCDDITDLKQAEAQLLAAHRELQEKNRQLAELNASKDKLFSIIAHDLRSPFTALLALSETVLHFLDDYSREELRDNMQQIQTTSEAVSALLENLLAWSRLQRGLMDYHPEYLDVAGILRETTELFQARARQKQVTVNLIVPQGTTVYADRNMLTTIMRNLLSNALKFTSEGQRVTLSAQPETDAVLIRVADTGLGIAPEHLDTLFQLDKQYTQPGTAGEKGSGLGLKLCRELVEAQGGAISVESLPGVGTTFTLRFAVSEPQE